MWKLEPINRMGEREKSSTNIEYGCAAIFGLKQKLANMKQIFIRFEANKCFTRLFRTEKNQRILHAKLKRNRIFLSTRIFSLFRFKTNILRQNEGNISKKRILIEA